MRFENLMRLVVLLWVVGWQTLLAADQTIRVDGFGGKLLPLKVGKQVFSNRDYVWVDVPQEFRGWQFTQLPGGLRQPLRVRADHDGPVFIATNGIIKSSGKRDAWAPVEGQDLTIDSGSSSRLTLYRRELLAGESVRIPSVGFSGGIVLAPSLRSGSSLQPDKIPGTVISHLPVATASYVGSPTICRGDDGRLTAAHSVFGRRLHDEGGETRIFESLDDGKTWQRIGTVLGQTWSTLFRHREALYLMGTRSAQGDAVIRRSDDHGRTWTEPNDGRSGRIRQGSFHTAPTPVVVRGGRIWRAIEVVGNRGTWPGRYHAAMLSADVDADLLRADAWTLSSTLAAEPSWLPFQRFPEAAANRRRTNGKTAIDGFFVGWLEGNAVRDPNGPGCVNLLRVETPLPGSVAAIIHYQPDGTKPTFSSADDIVDMPGGCKKFTVRWDPASERYWSLTSTIDPDFQPTAGMRQTKRSKALGWVSAAQVRNVLSLISSKDLRRWKIEREILRHPDPERVGFQYADWLFDGDDLIAVVRMSHFDGITNARNHHDSNLMTFHRIKHVRRSEN